MVFNAFLLNTQQCKVRIKGKWGNPEKGVVPFLHLCLVAIEKVAFRSSSMLVRQLTHIYFFSPALFFFMQNVLYSQNIIILLLLLLFYSFESFSYQC